MTTVPKRQPIPFGKYLLLDRVNIGGMAEVWRAKTFGAGGFERLVAIKRILPNIAEDEEFITMFIDEAKITVALNHANVGKIDELNHIANSYFIAMEYISGKDMRAVFDRCRKRGEPAPIPLTAYVVALCCEGLDYAHRAKDKHGRDMNIVHRDVSPQNLLVSYDGEVKVIDFGIAKAAGKATKTQAGILKGKFGYMSPEQIRGLPLDRRSDVFAIGVCLYEMLTGERLFVGDSDFSVLEKVRKVEVLPPSHFNRKIPEQLERIVMKSLAKDVDDRYQYASELGEDLRAFMYSTGNAFTRKDLSAFMKATFAEDYDKERNRLQEYADIKPPEGLVIAAEMGFGVGAMPAIPGLNTNASAVTSVPTVIPPNAPPVLPAANGLPPMVRPMPPVLSHNAPTLGPGNRTPSVAGLPKLTAVAPLLTNEKDEHQATQLVDGAAAFDDSTNPGNDATRALNLRNLAAPPPVPNEIPTDPGRPPVGRQPPAVEPIFPQAQWSELPTMAERVSRPLATNANGAPNQPRRLTRPMAITSDTAPTLGPALGSQPSYPSGPAYAINAPPQNNTRLIIALAGIVALLLIGLVAAVMLKPPLYGYVVIDVPEELRGKVVVEVNKDKVTEKDGTPLKEWPVLHKVKVGSANVRLTAPGYEPLFETVQVREDDTTQLSKVMKKSSK